MTAFPEPCAGTFDGPVHRYAVRAHFEDTDLTGMVYHANYLKWFERARSDMVRLLGIDQRAAHHAGQGAYAVTDLAVRYRSPARLDDVATIESRALDLRGASCRIGQRALLAAHPDAPVLLVEAEVRVAFVGPDGRPRRQPDAWRKAFERIMHPAHAGRSPPLDNQGTR